jgi:agmatinase
MSAQLKSAQLKADLIRNFDPSGIGIDNGNFGGLPFDYDTADIVLFGVPWEVTVSYNAGTAAGPQAVLDASRQLDLYDLDHPNGWKQGIFMAEIPTSLQEKSNLLRQQAAEIIDYMEQGNQIADNPELVNLLAQINQACADMNRWLFLQAQAALNQGKRIGIIGGDHSVPLGGIQALAEHYPDFGILHIDAHADLRHAYEGFQFSHASIMDNVCTLPQVSRLVQVGVRDICQDEVNQIQQSNGRIITHYDPVLKEKLYGGATWMELCQQMIASLPQQVYVSFDVDGLDPKLCPNTGTPVPGGLELEQGFCLLRELVRSGRELIGFDVSEVGDRTWDGNVGARIVYKLCNLMGLCGQERV